nr:diguanylate cyclase [Sulfitobacter brevis]
MNMQITPEALDILCPMHLLIGPSGQITHAGPTIQKLRRARAITGQRFLDVFTINRPHTMMSVSDLRRATNVKLHLEMRDPPKTALKGIMTPLGSAQDDLILNLSFGISILDGVRDYHLTNADFAATDLAIEMLYLIEAKTAAMEASRRLNLRLQNAKVTAEKQAFTDTLTGLSNRRAMDVALMRLISKDASFAVMHVDLDYFKAVNDTLGHAAGDMVLQTVARVMVEETRETDTVARVGGDEFTLILPGVRDDDTLRRIGNRIIERLQEPVYFQGHACHISASIGTVRVHADQSRSAQDLLSDADLALYASKHAGRARHTFYTPDLRRTFETGEAKNDRGRQPV